MVRISINLPLQSEEHWTPLVVSLQPLQHPITHEWFSDSCSGVSDAQNATYPSILRKLSAKLFHRVVKWLFLIISRFHMLVGLKVKIWIHIWKQKKKIDPENFICEIDRSIFLIRFVVEQRLPRIHTNAQ